MWHPDETIKINFTEGGKEADVLNAITHHIGERKDGLPTIIFANERSKIQFRNPPADTDNKGTGNSNVYGTTYDEVKDTITFINQAADAAANRCSDEEPEHATMWDTNRAPG